MAITGRTATRAESASATSITGTIPTGTVAGDVMVVVFATSTASGSFVAPSAPWTQFVVPTTFNVETLAAYYAVATGSDTAPTGGGTTAGRITALMQSYIGVDNVTPIDVAAAITTFGNVNGLSSWALTGITTATDGAKVVSGISGDWATGTWTQPAGMSLVITHTSGTGRSAALADVDQASAGATGTKTWSDTAASGLAHAGFVGALRPSAAAGGVGATAQIFNPIPFM